MPASKATFGHVSVLIEQLLPLALQCTSFVQGILQHENRQELNKIKINKALQKDNCITGVL